MAATKIALHHRGRDKGCLAPVGFSWTTFFFGGFALLFRRPRAWWLTIGVCAVAVPTYAVSNLVVAFFANQLYVKTLIRKGYRMRDVPPDQLGDVLSKLGISRSRLDEIYDWGDLGPAPEAPEHGSQGEAFETKTANPPDPEQQTEKWT